MRLLENILFSKGEKRLRTAWRLGLQTGLMVVLWGCLMIPWFLLQGQIATGLGLLSLEIVEFLGINLSVFLARRTLDKRTLTSLGLSLDKQAAIDLLVGIGISALMMGLIYLLGSSLGWITFVQFAWETTPVMMVGVQSLVVMLTFFLVGWNEELLIRGYHLQNISEGINPFWGVVLSSVVFSGLHISNPNAGWFSSLGVTLAGVFLAYSYLKTRQLWLPIGLHIGWNVFEGLVFGFPVSGLGTFSLIQTEIDGPVLWTGGAFGPEAGLVLIPALILGSTLVWAYSRSGWAGEPIPHPFHRTG